MVVKKEQFIVETPYCLHSPWPKETTQDFHHQSQWTSQLFPTTLTRRQPPIGRRKKSKDTLWTDREGKGLFSGTPFNHSINGPRWSTMVGQLRVTTTYPTHVRPCVSTQLFLVLSDIHPERQNMWSLELIRVLIPDGDVYFTTSTLVTSLSTVSPIPCHLLRLPFYSSPKVHHMTDTLTRWRKKGSITVKSSPTVGTIGYEGGFGVPGPVKPRCINGLR